MHVYMCTCANMEVRGQHWVSSVTSNCIIIVFFLKIHFGFFVCLCMHVCVCVCRCPHRLEEGMESSGAGVTGSCELLNVGAGNRTAGPSLHPLTLFWGVGSLTDP